MPGEYTHLVAELLAEYQWQLQEVSAAHCVARRRRNEYGRALFGRDAALGSRLLLVWLTAGFPR